MRISEATVALTSTHLHEQQRLQEETLHFWQGNERPDFEGTGRNPPLPTPPAVVVTLSPEARARAKEELVASGKAEAETPAPPDEAAEDPKLRTIRLILEALTGRKIRVTRFTLATPDTPAIPAKPTTEGSAPSRQGWGLEYDYHQLDQEKESLQFAASGEIKTADGNTVQFNLEFTMSREVRQETSLSVRAGDARKVDPLVVNFDRSTVQLAGQRMAFDLNGDGKAEAMPSLASGSGFLALDRNNNGTIDSGTELFGPQTGNGFSELAKLDSDGNGWLDENDPMFEQLRIWGKDGAGNDVLYSLKDKEIGALLLDHAATPFSLTDGANNVEGQLRDTSIYLTESGRAGTIQELDVAV